MAKKTVLVAPDGREYTTTDRGEANRLVRGHGYRVKQEPKQTVTAKPTEKK